MEQYRYYGRNQGMQNRSTAYYDQRRAQESCGCDSNKKQQFDSCGCNSNKNQASDSCGCDFSALQKVENAYKEQKCCKDKPVGMAYVPMQAWEKLYDPENALCQGTAFPSLNLIFCGVRGKM